MILLIISGPALPGGGEDTFTDNVFDGKQYSNKAKIMINLVPRLRNHYHQYCLLRRIQKIVLPLQMISPVPITSDQPIRINLLEHRLMLMEKARGVWSDTAAFFSKMPIILENDSATVYYHTVIDVDIEDIKKIVLPIK